MTKLEEYISSRLAGFTIETAEEENFYKDNGRLRQDAVTDIRKRTHELKLLCEYGLHNQDLKDLSKAVYNRIVILDERPLQKK